MGGPIEPFLIVATPRVLGPLDVVALRVVARLQQGPCTRHVGTTDVLHALEEALAGRGWTPEPRLAREALREVAQRLDVLRRRDGMRLVVGLVVQHGLAHAGRA